MVLKGTVESLGPASGVSYSAVAPPNATGNSRRSFSACPCASESILGGNFRFSTKSNDPLNAKFYIFQIQPNGTYKLVG